MAPLRQTHGGCMAAATAQHGNYQYRIVFSDLSPQTMERFKNHCFTDHALIVGALYRHRSRSRSTESRVLFSEFLEAVGKNGLPLWNGKRLFFEERCIKKFIFASVSLTNRRLKFAKSKSEVILTIKELLGGGTVVGTLAIFGGDKDGKGYPEYGEWVYEGHPNLAALDEYHTVVIMGVVMVDNELGVKFRCPEGEYILYQESRGEENANLSILGNGLCLAHPRVLLRAYQLPCRVFTPEVMRDLIC